MLVHVSMRCSDAGASGGWHDAVLAPMGITRVIGFEAVAVSWSDGKPDVWIGQGGPGEVFREPRRPPGGRSLDLGTSVPPDR